MIPQPWPNQFQNLGGYPITIQNGWPITYGSTAQTIVWNTVSGSTNQEIAYTNPPSAKKEHPDVKWLRKRVKEITDLAFV